MKKNFIFCLFGIFLFQFTATGQQWLGTSGSSGNLYRTGNVSIGTSSSSQKLRVQGNIRLSGDLMGYQTSGTLDMFANTNHTNGAYVRMYGNSGGSKGQMTLCSYSTGDIKFFNYTNGWRERMRVQDNGKVVIGSGSVSQPSSGYLLAVDQGIQTEKVKVCASSSGWCDYVFADDYSLQTIYQVEAFVKKYKHLPNVPSAQEVEDNGIDVAAMDATLLRQIEELWLHVIDLKKENDALKTEVEQLKK